MRMSGLTVNDLTYSYRQVGSGAPLLLLHGFTGSKESWAPLMSKMASAGALLAVDLPGHGQTEAPPEVERYTMQAVAADLVELTRTIQPGPWRLLGYSMGGRLALFLALTYPALFTKVILESASPGLEFDAERQARLAADERLATAIEIEGIEPFVSRWEQLPLFESQRALPAAVQLALRAQRLANRPLGLANSLRGMGTGIQPNLWPELVHLTQPLLLLAGALDTKFVAINSRMATLAPTARLEIMPNAGHTIHLERPQRFRALLLDWLSKPH